MKRIFLSSSLAVFLCLFAVAQQPSFLKDSLDNYIQRGLKEWSIPGLAIAIVKDGKVITMKGYGVKDIKTNEPVDENTLFFIASNSKLFTGTALAQLEYHNKLNLNDRVTKYFPDFKLFDSNTTALVNIRDMLAHHLGTKTFQGDFTFWNSNISRPQIMYKMRYLKPHAQFRQSFGYCNSCFLTAGEVIPLVTGKPWEVYIYDSILMPLGMTNTHMLTQGFEQRANVSKAYTNNFTGTLTELPYDQIDNLAPAGSMVSCVKDMAKWLMFQLDSGNYNGKKIMPWPVLKRTREMETILKSEKSPLFPSNFRGYGLGVFIGDYNGRQIYWHTGGADGFVTNTCFVPEENLGITILTNNDNQSFFEALRYQILDAYLGVPYVNRSDQQKEYFVDEFTKLVQDVKTLQARVKGNKPPHPLSIYTGTYTNPIYGEINIEEDSSNLKINFKGHNRLTGKLEYLDNDEWLLTYSNIAFGIFPAKFTIEKNKVVSVNIKASDFIEYDPYTFIKK